MIKVTDLSKFAGCDSTVVEFGMTDVLLSGGISRDVKFASNLGQNCPKWVKSGTLLRSVSVHFDSAIQNVLKLILTKSQMCPIWR